MEPEMLLNVSEDTSNWNKEALKVSRNRTPEFASAENENLYIQKLWGEDRLCASLRGGTWNEWVSLAKAIIDIESKRTLEKDK